MGSKVVARLPRECKRLIDKDGNTFADRYRALNHEEAILADDIQVGYAVFTVVLGKHKPSEGDAAAMSVFIRRKDRGVFPAKAGLRVSMKHQSGSHASRQQPGTISCSFEGRLFMPEWISEGWDPDLATIYGSVWGLNTFCTEEEMLSNAQENGGQALALDVTITLEEGAPPAVERCLDGAGAVDWLLHSFGNPEAAPPLIAFSGDGFEIRAPRALVCPHSPVLAAAFEHDTEERQSGRLRLPGVSRQQLEDFLRCLYVGGLDAAVLTCWERVVDLLVLADKYGVERLAAACEDCLSAALAPQNAAKMLLHADRHSLLELRRTVLCFLAADARHKDAVLESDEFAAFGADLLRVLHAYAPPVLDGPCPLPQLLLWRRRPWEFPAGTAWEALGASALRRACAERCLATEGSAAELRARLCQEACRRLPAGRHDVESEPV